ncbi:MAG: dihydrolipoyl dehydrogenase [Planctomycetes bacterium]|jgi:dihydrolipoamide dehydrogenase|nr:dihydrolipoyl dehydrogenase [Planctomycetota bacterium]MBT4029846.1 dihydrolipoyl dehydrogenase [Planctomycetota bacterium]MBT4559940.1 dihydrolipoyl dehydrogenase [Planctomycetota bacterium]MBT5119107.1 dihydrolipoyl dehydrogenase [Planctomycetota bacterium]MBT7012335.1 dihydrolipoyl dehydrogenase [Planctomycetota bacterium]
MSQIQTDLAILGAGPAGYVCALRAADLGKKVTIIEAGPFGGTCLNVGCIPSKALISAGHFVESVHNAAAMGFTVAEPELDLEKLIAWKDGIVGRLTGGIGALLKSRGVDVVHGRGQLTSANSIEVATQDGTQQTVQARDIVLATGSEPTPIPGFEFSDKVWSSTEALSPKELPKSLFVIGGGVIGMELGMFYAHLGVAVTIVEFMDQILPGIDPELVKIVQRRAKKAGIKIYTQSAAKSWQPKGDGVEVTAEVKGKEKTFAADAILLTVGRRPRTGGLGLDSAGLKTDERGFLVVDDHCQTKTAHVYAIGDITPGPMLAHKGSAQGLVAAGSIANSPGVKWDYKVVPGVIFTDPEIAVVGLTEAEALEAGHEIKVGRFNFAGNGRAMSMQAKDGLTKVITDAKDDTILGVHMCGPNVTDMIAEAAVAIEAGLTAEDIALTIHPHPTLSEVFLEACEDVHGMSPHAMKKK